MGLSSRSRDKQEQVYQAGYAAYQNKDYTAARRLFTGVARQGHVLAQFYLAMLVEHIQKTEPEAAAGN